VELARGCDEHGIHRSRIDCIGERTEDHGTWCLHRSSVGFRCVDVNHGGDHGASNALANADDVVRAHQAGTDDSDAEVSHGNPFELTPVY
jgi:hypothetical protein